MKDRTFLFFFIENIFCFENDIKTILAFLNSRKEKILESIQSQLYSCGWWIVDKVNGEFSLFRVRFYYFISKTTVNLKGENKEYAPSYVMAGKV